MDGKNGREIAESFAYSEASKQVARVLNGSFIIVINRRTHVEVISDRFGSIPLFYSNDNGKLIVSTDYFTLINEMPITQSRQLCLESIVEFVYLQRLHGAETFHAQIKVLGAGIVLTYKNDHCAVKVEKYWTPDFSKSNDSENDLAVELAEALQESVKRRIPDGESIGLLLSGGLDSRAILAAFPDDIKPHCYTIGELKNNEVMVAEQVANAAGCEWQFIERNVHHYSNILDEAVLKGAGMYVFHHGHFFGFDWETTSNMFHGHGLDYFFQGMYLPYKNFKIFGGNTFYRYLISLDPEGLINTYINGAKFRLKSEGLDGLIRTGVKEEFLESVRSKLTNLVNTISSDAAEIYDMWDYLYLHNPSRHYTYLNVISMNTESTAQVTAAFDNDVHDQYLKMPAHMRMNGSVYIKSINHMNSSLMNVRSANTNLLAEPSATKMTIKAVNRKLLRLSGLKNTDAQYPSKKDGSWPKQDDLVSANMGLRQRMARLIDSDALDSLNIFNMDSLKLVVEGQLSNERNNGDLILTLLTVQELIKKTDLGGSIG